MGLPKCSEADDGSPAASGPIPVRNQRVFNQLFLQFQPELPDTLSRGESRFRLQLDVANNMLIPASAGGSSLLEDYETQRITLAWRCGLGKGYDAAAYVPVVWRNGGFLDEVLRAWHRFWGIPRAADTPLGRDTYPNYRSAIQLTDAAGNKLLSAGAAFGPGDVTITIRREILASTAWRALSVRAGVKLPTGNPRLLLGSGNADAGLMVDGRLRLGRDFSAYASGGVVWIGRPSRVPGARSMVGQYLLALEYHPNRRDRFLWQIDGAGAAVRTGNRFADGEQITATFGYRRLVNDRLTLYAAFSENGDYHDYSAPLLGNVGPDFTATLGMEWRR